MDGDIGALLKMPVPHLKGVGRARALLLNKLGIFTIGDALYYFPREYEDRSSLKAIAQLVDGETCAFEGVVSSAVSETRPRRGFTIQKTLVRDSTGAIFATWFNQPYLKNSLKQGEKYFFYGKISRKYRTLEVLSPVYEKAGEGETKNTCRIVPVYPSTANLTQNAIRSAIRSALEAAGGRLADALPGRLRDGYGLEELNYCLENIHFPSCDNAFHNARRRLVFEELLLLQLALFGMKNKLDDESGGIAFSAAKETEAFTGALPFRLTPAQRRVFGEIAADMESKRAMNRLVQGDVGSGKTAVAALALYKAAKSGYQGAFMAPTEILAEQHYRTLGSLLKESGLRVVLLTGSQGRSEKSGALEDIKSGAADLVVGTHALIDGNVEFKKLGLVVTDEQHRFGVRQRAALSRKGPNPDMLVMTATPIPRTLALILYGDLDISVIDELPPGRKPVETYVVDNGMRERINRFIRKKVAEGRQVFIVCPLVEESDTIEAKSAVELAERIASKDFAGLRVGLVHGRMRPAEKDSVMDSFIKGETDILVSTTVIEVGVDVPNATVMVVENAERFGLAQLHQLRGRVGRGEHQSYCILYNEGKSDIARERMQVMQKTGDGFLISEKDLELRGQGEFFGTRQHGIPDLKIANLYKDMEILKQAQEAALEILKEDRHLERAEYGGLRASINERFGARIKELSLN